MGQKVHSLKEVPVAVSQRPQLNGKHETENNYSTSSKPKSYEAVSNNLTNKKID